MQRPSLLHLHFKIPKVSKLKEISELSSYRLYIISWIRLSDEVPGQDVEQKSSAALVITGNADKDELASACRIVDR